MSYSLNQYREPRSHESRESSAIVQADLDAQRLTQAYLKGVEGTDRAMRLRRLERLVRILREVAPDPQLEEARAATIPTPPHKPRTERADGLIIGEPCTRWSPRRKEDVLLALRRGTHTLEQVLACYPSLSAEEVASWQDLYHRHGYTGLCVTKLQRTRGR